MCKTDQKTRQKKTILYRSWDLLAVRKHMMSWLLTLEDKNETKYNSISFLYCNS